MLAAATLMSAVGVIDDTRGLRAIVKLYAQVAVAIAIAVAEGFYVEFINDGVLEPKMIICLLHTVQLI